MVARRLLWGVAGAAALLWLARAARAGTREADTEAAPASRRAASTGYAAESARTATRLPPGEREARQFLRMAALRGRFEAEASRLALTRAHDAAIRAFAEELLQYHEAAGTELLHLLHARGMAPPMMEGPQRKALNRLAQLAGARFDREFIELVGRERQLRDVQQYERAALGLADPALAAWVDRQLPSLRQQQAAAARLVPSRRGEDLRRRAVAAKAADGRP